MATFAFAYSPPDCPRKRKRQTWTDEENRIILSSVRRLGTQWDLVAAQLPGRTADAVRNQCHQRAGWPTAKLGAISSMKFAFLCVEK